ncbi:hypothetical protein AWM79_18925 [Pseudomonas agarici]|uniref:Uncharacterized protein n=1 Tax=Pseudomonas agarici TaxID=46677 RepID=A0A0X1T558_PSEAA|nr:hypothetical protein [Pseudomonas agarici]AMB87253.1 hypothetical protein AWM79_18925 [Pseudomonas agarici]NWB92696.1 hypothetical protein [Pseudomonas agarici]NWC10656.1 hypothetical protein [Pseudomonas agarici]SEL12256.1 hypothetical protein SAMN05216604_111125 [Pseudomonas agarici]
MVMRIQTPAVSTTPPAATIELVARTASDMENAQIAAPPPGFAARAAQAASGLSQAFHRQCLAPAWKSMSAAGAAAYQGGVSAGNTIKHTAVQSWADTAANLPSGRSTLAAAGQTLQQMVTCGLPTYAREVAFMHTYSALADGLAQKSPGGALALQAAISLATVASHVYVRQPRLDRLGTESTVAVRGHFALSESQWNALGADQQQARREQMQRDSRNVTRNQIAAEAIYLGLGALGTARGDGALSARILATQLRNVLYAVSRETLQASLSLTGKHDHTKTYGVNEDNMAMLGWAYGAMTLSMGFIQDSISPRTLPPGQTLSSPALTGADHRPLRGEALARSIQTLAGTRAAFNTVTAILDGHLQKHLDTRQAGTTQRFKASLPLKDYGRLLDQSPVRVAWSSLASAVNMAMGELTRGTTAPALSSFLGNTGTALAMGLAYRTMSQTVQAHGSVRKAIEARPATAVAVEPAQARIEAQAGLVNRRPNARATIEGDAS